MIIVNELKNIGFKAAIVKGSNVKVALSAQQLTDKLKELVNQRSNMVFPPESLKDGVRKLLKKGGFKPTGRNKPASEYLAQAAREGRFPYINNLVDINNYLSLLSGLPISLLDLNVTGEKILLRTGKKEEKYVFNTGGQVIDLEGLICVCRHDPYPGSPLGNPVKDSMEGKIKDNTTDVVGVIYCPEEFKDTLTDYAEQFGEMFKLYANASSAEVIIE